MHAIDRWVLSGFTRVAHAIQRFCGISCYQLAHHACVAIVLCDILELADDLWPWVMPSRKAFPAVLDFAMVLIWINNGHRTLMAEREWRASPTVLPASAIGWQWDFSMWMRLFGVVLTVLITVIPCANAHAGLDAVILHSFGFLCLSWMYFMTVTPLPPCESTIREWSRSIGAFFARRQPIAPTS